MLHLKKFFSIPASAWNRTNYTEHSLFLVVTAFFDSRMRFIDIAAAGAVSVVIVDDTAGLQM